MTVPVQSADAHSPPLLEVEGLSKRFPMRRSLIDLALGKAVPVLKAVDRVSLTVERGETLGIVGESGCGKSTLARCLVRLYEPDDGQVRFAGRDVLALEGAARRAYHAKVQMIFQDPYGSLNPRLSVAGALGEVLSVHGLAQPAEVPSRVKALLDLVHLPHSAAARYPHEFSGGQRQRLGIARALAVEPSLLIADEPVALDVSVQAQIINLVLELQARLGLAVIFITHDLRLVRHIAHRTSVMYLGRIVESGPTEPLFRSPRHPYTQALIRAVPKMVASGAGRRTRKAAVRGELPSLLAPPPGCPFHPRCAIAEARCRTDVPDLSMRSPCPSAGTWTVACHLAGPSSDAT